MRPRKFEYIFYKTCNREVNKFVSFCVSLYFLPDFMVSVFTNLNCEYLTIDHVTNSELRWWKVILIMTKQPKRHYLMVGFTLETLDTMMRSVQLNEQSNYLIDHRKDYYCTLYRIKSSIDLFRIMHCLLWIEKKSWSKSRGYR